MNSLIDGNGDYKLITHWMLRGKYRQYVIDKIKKPLMKALVILAKRYPYPTKENTLFPNTHVLIDLRDEFLSHCQNPPRKTLFEAIWRVFICEYEHDPYYHFRIDWVIDKIRESKTWKENPRKTWNYWSP
jgi:hypothetical protein